jgi:AcrR family transcriptional regulator
MPSREQNKQRARQAIVAAAAELIASRGYEATTTRQVAAAAGISYQTLYNHFPSKSAIVEAIVTDGQEAVAAQIDQIIKEYAGDVLASLALVNRVRMQFIDDKGRELWQIASKAHGTQFDARHERYYALLSMAQGMGDLVDTVDLHLMAHTLSVLAGHTLRLYVQHDVQHDSIDSTVGPESDRERLLRTLNEQVALLVSPYLSP